MKNDQWNRPGDHCKSIKDLSLRFYQETFEIVEQDYWEVPTIDYKQLPTNYYLRLFRGADFYEDFPFVIEDNIMHINVCGPTYFYTAFMFERVK